MPIDFTKTFVQFLHLIYKLQINGENLSELQNLNSIAKKKMLLKLLKQQAQALLCLSLTSILIFGLDTFSHSNRIGSHGVMVSTLDFESSDPSSNLGGTWQDSFSFSKIAPNKLSFRYLIFQYFDFSHGVGNFIETACPSPVLLQLYVNANFLTKFHSVKRIGSHGVMVSTLDSESSDPSSNLGGTWRDLFSLSKIVRNKPRFRHLIF